MSLHLDPYNEPGYLDPARSNRYIVSANVAELMNLQMGYIQ